MGHTGAMRILTTVQAWAPITLVVYLISMQGGSYAFGWLSQRDNKGKKPDHFGCSTVALETDTNAAAAAGAGDGDGEGGAGGAGGSLSPLPSPASLRTLPRVVIVAVAVILVAAVATVAMDWPSSHPSIRSICSSIRRLRSRPCRAFPRPRPLCDFALLASS